MSVCSAPERGAEGRLAVSLKSSRRRRLSSQHDFYLCIIWGLRECVEHKKARLPATNGALLAPLSGSSRSSERSVPASRNLPGPEA